MSSVKLLTKKMDQQHDRYLFQPKRHSVMGAEYVLDEILLHWNLTSTEPVSCPPFFLLSSIS